MTEAAKRKQKVKHAGVKTEAETFDELINDNSRMAK
jgi:hypothetical protein